MSFFTQIKKEAQKVRSKLGAVTISKDPEFDKYKREIQDEKKKLQNNIKNLNVVISNFAALSTSLQIFANEMKKSYPKDDSMVTYLTQIEDVMSEFDVNHYSSFREKMKEKTKNLSEFQKRFNQVKPMIDKRDNAKIEFDNLTHTVKKLASKPQKDPKKLPTASAKLKKASKFYNDIAKKTKSQMAQLLDNLGEVYDPVIANTCSETAEMCVLLNGTFQKIGRIGDEIKTSDFNRGKRTVTGVVDDAFDDSFEEQVSAPPAIPKKRPAKPAKRIAVPKKFDVEWYFLDEDVQQQGPFSFTQMKKKYKNQMIDDETHIFGGDLEDWISIGSFTEFKKFLK